VAIPRGSSKREGSFILTTERAKHMTALKSSWSLLEVFLTIGLSSKSTHNHVIFPVAVLIISTCSVPDERFIQSTKKTKHNASSQSSRSLLETTAQMPSAAYPTTRITTANSHNVKVSVSSKTTF
jgi:hypothetical protein